MAHPAPVDTLSGTLSRHAVLTDRLGRMGGDEFLLVCPNSTMVDTEQIVRRIIGHPGIPAASWGIASSDDDGAPAR